MLWGMSAGRCELCNRLLYMDSTFGIIDNFAEQAHIHAVSKNGPRFKEDMSDKECNDVNNLMLLCQEHHKMVDDSPEDFQSDLLIEKKRIHEERIRKVSDIIDEQSTSMVAYFSNIDGIQITHEATLFRQALLKAGLLPKQNNPINLSSHSVRYQPNQDYYLSKAKELDSAFKEYFEPIFKKEDAVALFSLAPQPLLIKLGTLINDQYNVRVFQCHRTGHKWAWKDCNDSKEYQLLKVDEKNETDADSVGLNISLSADISTKRIRHILHPDSPIFKITINEPNRYFVTNENISNDFVKCFRTAMEQIKNQYPKCKTIHLFPAMPVSLAVQLGMDYMPKADLPIVIYDEVKELGGFIETITIGGI